ncbi:MAG: sensor histidine kinase, partial [Pseudomonadota bacterium]
RLDYGVVRAVTDTLFFHGRCSMDLQVARFFYVATLLLILAGGVVGAAHAQEQKDRLRDGCGEARYVDPEACIALARSVLASLPEERNPDEEATAALAHMFIGFSLFAQTNYDAAEQALTRAAEGLDGFELLETKQNLYLIQHARGDYAAEIDSIQEVLDLSMDIQEWRTNAYAYYDLYLIMRQIGDDEKARVYAERMEAVIQEHDLEGEIVSYYLDLVKGDIALIEERFADALRHYQAYGAAVAADGGEGFISEQEKLAQVYIELGDYEAAIRAASLAVADAADQDAEDNRIAALILKARAARKAGSSRTAYLAAAEAFRRLDNVKLGGDGDFVMAPDVQKELGLSLIALGRDDEATEVLDDAFDSLRMTFAAQKRDAIAIAEVEADRLIRQQQLELLQQKSGLAALQIERQEARILAAFAVAAFLAAVSFGLYRSNRLGRAALEQKTAFVTEIQHRAQNNLQLISSLLSMEARDRTERLDRDTSGNVLPDARARVQTMARLNEHLYIDDRTPSVGAENYIGDVARDIMASYASEDVDLVLDVNPMEIDVTLATPIGLIICELMTNALKYAFADLEGGSITVAMRRIDDELELRIVDDGNGLYDADKATGIGVPLVYDLAAQIRGSLSVESEPGQGTSWTLNLPAKRAAITS